MLSPMGALARSQTCFRGGLGTGLNMSCGSGQRTSTGRRFVRQRDRALFLLERMPDFQITAEARVARTFQNIRLFQGMTVLENLMMGAYGRDDKPAIARDLEQVYALFEILRQRSSQLGGTLSGGEQQMLAIGRAIMSKPRLLMMDEPSMGIAPLLVAKIFEAVKALNRQGLTILLVEQNARAALKLAHRGYVLETGRVTLADDASKLLVDPRVREAYLGDG